MLLDLEGRGQGIGLHSQGAALGDLIPRGAVYIRDGSAVVDLTVIDKVDIGIAADAGHMKQWDIDVQITGCKVDGVNGAAVEDAIHGKANLGGIHIVARLLGSYRAGEKNGNDCNSAQAKRKGSLAMGQGVKTNRIHAEDAVSLCFANRE